MRQTLLHVLHGVGVLGCRDNVARGEPQMNIGSSSGAPTFGLHTARLLIEERLQRVLSDYKTDKEQIATQLDAEYQKRKDRSAKGRTLQVPQVGDLVFVRRTPDAVHRHLQILPPTAFVNFCGAPEPLKVGRSGVA